MRNVVEPERPGEPRLDAALGAWLLTRHADVAAALRDPRLAVPGTAAGASTTTAVYDLAPARAVGRRAELEASARAVVATLPADVPVDLVAAFARPWSAALAARMTGAPPVDADRLDRLAREMFLAAATATGGGMAPAALAAVAELAVALPGAPGDVQGFVAVSQTLPCVLAGAWHALVRHPAEADRLRAEPGLMTRAVEELLRYAGPARAVFRRAADAVEIGGARIGPGDRVALLLAAANRDPARFPDPARLDVGRDAAGHLAFGAGAHACPGEPLVRVAVGAATAALLGSTTAIEPAGDVEWVGGFAIRGPGVLPVVLRRGRE